MKQALIKYSIVTLVAGIVLYPGISNSNTFSDMGQITGNGNENTQYNEPTYDELANDVNSFQVHDPSGSDVLDYGDDIGEITATPGTIDGFSGGNSDFQVHDPSGSDVLDYGDDIGEITGTPGTIDGFSGGNSDFQVHDPNGSDVLDYGDDIGEITGTPGVIGGDFGGNNGRDASWYEDEINAVPGHIDLPENDHDYDDHYGDNDYDDDHYHRPPARRYDNDVIGSPRIITNGDNNDNDGIDIDVNQEVTSNEDSFNHNNESFNDNQNSNNNYFGDGNDIRVQNGAIGQGNSVNVNNYYTTNAQQSSEANAVSNPAPLVVERPVYVNRYVPRNVNTRTYSSARSYSSARASSSSHSSSNYSGQINQVSQGDAGYTLTFKGVAVQIMPGNGYVYLVMRDLENSQNIFSKRLDNSELRIFVRNQYTEFLLVDLASNDEMMGFKFYN